MAIKGIGISNEIAKIMNDYSDEAKEALDEAAKKAAEITKDQLRNTSPGSGEYAKSWNVKNQSTRTNPSYIVHNVKHYRLTHLLERGHMVANQFGTFGREPAQPHIGDAEQKGIVEFENLIHEKLG